MKEHIDVAKDFIDFISESPTKYHAIENVKSKLYRTGQLGINCILHEFS